MIAVLVADVRAQTRRALRGVFELQRDIAVVGEAADPEALLRLCSRVRPDVVLLGSDLGPGAAAVTLRVMRDVPVPLLVLERGAASAGAFEALRLGAIDVVTCLRGGEAITPGEAAALVRAVRTAASARVVRRRVSSVAALGAVAPPKAARTVIAIGASTGGPPALATILGALPEGFPAPVLLVQHIVDGFMGQFAAWLAGELRLRVKIAEEGEPLLGGCVYLAGSQHLAIDRAGRARVLSTPPVGGHQPAINVLFESLAACSFERRIGVLLTGMGEDGARGLKALRESSGYTLAQDEGSSVVFGMARVAIQAGAVDEVLPVESIGPRLMAIVGAAAPGGARTTARSSR